MTACYGKGTWGRPVPIVPVRHDSIARPASKIIGPCLETGEVLRDGTFVPIVLIWQPTEQKVTGGNRVRRLESPAEWDGIGNSAIRGLRIANVIKKLRQEPGQAKVVDRLFQTDRQVVHPPLALIALRAIGGHAVQVARLGPPDHLLDAV